LIKSRIALKFAIAIKETDSIATCYNTIAATFDELSEPDKASSTKGLVYANRTTNDKKKTGCTTTEISALTKEYEKGIYYYRKSLEYSTKIMTLHKWF
jgi:hypothetical protein